MYGELEDMVGRDIEAWVREKGLVFRELHRRDKFKMIEEFWKEKLGS